MFEVGQLVILKNDKDSNIYKIKEIDKSDIFLIGYNIRTKIKVNIEDLVIAPKKAIDEVSKSQIKIQNAIIKTKPRGKKYLYGRVLHIDGDEDYLESCMSLYSKVGIKAQGIYIKEKEIPFKIEDILLYLTPDIIVITGHDNFNNEDIKNIDNYENSKIFGDAIRIIRKHFSDVVIIAGACKSHFEYLIGKGANFASSPGRINTHTYDPAIVAIKVASTSKNQTVDFSDISKFIEGGRKAIGGVETEGKMKLIY